jgi:putative transposase
MNDILALLQPIQNNVSQTTLRQLSRIIAAMLAMTGRVTMLGLSRWTEKGGSYRTIQQFFYTVIPWTQVFWTFFSVHLMDRQDTYLLAGDESVVTKAGDKTHGLDFFFSGLLKKAVPGLSFFTLALISTQQRHAYPISVEQMIRTKEEKVGSQAKKEAKKAKSTGPKGTRASEG